MPRKTRKPLSVFERHQANIARQTLRMPDAILGVMGGMTREQARSFLEEHGLKEEEEKEEAGQENDPD